MKKIVLFMMMFFIPMVVDAVTREEYLEAITKVSMSAATTYSDEFAYSFYWGGTPENPVNVSEKTTKVWLKNAYNGIKSSGYKYGSTKAQAGIQGSFKDKFGVFCESFVRLMMYHASGGVLDYYDDFETIKVSELRKGDFIHFPGHIAIYIDDNNDDKKSTYNVVEASRDIHYSLISNTPDYGKRIKESSLAKLNYNQVMASFDFHDRLDDYAPIIYDVKQVEDRILINATDYKKYELAERSDILEPENYGIVGYQITTTNVEPTKWNNINKNAVINEEFHGVSKKGTYYVWVIDVGGNVASKTLIATDYKKDINEIGTLKHTVNNSSEINVTIENAMDSDGIKEYRYYLNNNLVNGTNKNTFVFSGLDANTSYSFYYEIVDNKNNVYKSSIYQAKTLKSVNSFKLQEKVVTIKMNDSYKINTIVDSIDNNYVIKYLNYDKNIILVDENGIIKGISKGTTYISVMVEDFVEVMRVSVEESKDIPSEVPQKKDEKVNVYDILLIIVVVIITVTLIKLIYDLIKKRKR